MPTMQRHRRKRSLRSRLLLIAVGLGLGLVAAEAALRVAGISHPVPYAPDRWCGSKLQPNFSGHWSKEGRAAFHTNSLGFRDCEHTIRKPTKTRRIAVLGDSYIEALQVSDDATFARRLESEFFERPIDGKFDVEVLSFGVSGWGTAQQLLALRNYVWQFDPDVVVLAFLADNDVRNNSRRLEPMQCRPFFRLTADSKLIPDESFLAQPEFLVANKTITHWKNAIINFSRVIQLGRELRDSVKESSSGSSSDDVIEAGLEFTSMVPPITPDWIEAWDITDRLIVQMSEEVHDRGRRFVVMTIPSAIQVDPDGLRRDAVQKRLEITDSDYAEHRLAALSELHPFLLVSLAAPMRAWAETHQAWLHGFPNTKQGTGHWNENGHRVAAKICADALRPFLSAP